MILAPSRSGGAPSAAAIATFLLAAILALGSCSSAPRISPDMAEALKAAAGSMAAAVPADPADLAPLRKGIEDFLLFIAEERGQEAATAIAAMREPDELAPYLAAKYGVTAYEEALSAFTYWAARAEGPSWDERSASRLETTHFMIETMPGSAAHADRAYLARLLEKQFTEVVGLIGPSAEMRANLERNIASFKDGKIAIILPPGTRELKGFGSTAATNFGLSSTGDGLAVTASIVLPYYNALSSAILAHEVTHAVEIFIKLDESTMPGLPRPGASDKEKGEAVKAFVAWAKPAFQAIAPNDQAFGEGFAEYAAMRFSPLHRAFFPDPDALLRVMSRRVKPLDDVLARSPAMKDRKLRIVRYTELNSFVTYLIDRYGLERFLDFYMSVPVSEKRFVEVYGKGYKAMQADWRTARPPL